MSVQIGPGDLAVAAAPGRSPGTPRRMRPWTPYAFLAPYLILFAVFMLLPIGFGFWTSLHEWDINLPDKPFVGLENYAELFDPAGVDGSRFWTAMRATGIFTVASVPPLIVLPLLVALLMNGRFKGRNVYRAVYFAPYVLGVAVVGFVWRFLLDGNIGLVNHYLGLDVQWTTDVPPAWIALVGVTVWWTLGLNSVIFLAGLQDIPRELHEAAMVDGASAWHRFRSVTLPGLRPVTVFVVNSTILASANMFGQSYLITGGAPADQTKTAIYLIAETGLRQFDMGTASAMSFILAGFLMVASALVFGAFRDRGKR
ncbi:MULTISPECIES: carbohydrate ABC transporter permease [Streptosporangium]|uniref:Multiple sugar transport system permease protein n=1 Tax=Streptosporangium brasiliense TaxID=47480 RepID=A0ABT9QYE2_9ACTN|nr:sugar ABC transporter permease [Streptosporangium brasiliense]MDP9861544.1 multiple sugar transport system permease protein [Streptosporangium brasiliense]